MLKKINYLLAILLILITYREVKLVYAAGNTEADFTFTDNGVEVTITGYTNMTIKDVEIPSTIGGKPVTAIGERAFENQALTSVKIPDNVLTIGQGAFYGNELTNIEIPSSVTFIGGFAFMRNKLISVEIPDSVTLIEGQAFAINQLTSVKLPSNMTTIWQGLFKENQLMNIEIPSSVTTIHAGAFAKNKLTSVEIPPSVTTIEEEVFTENELTMIDISSNITSIGDGAFAKNKLAAIEIPSSVTSIGANAFAQNQLTSVNLPSSIISIGRQAFAYNQLTSVELPPNMTVIEIGILRDNQLRKVELPLGITHIKDDAFANNQLIHVEIPSTVTQIDSRVFKNNRLTHVKLPDSIQIGISAFAENWLSEVQFEGTATIYPNAFGQQAMQDNTFLAWYQKDGMPFVWDDTNPPMVVSAMTVHAKWASYILDFKTNGGSEIPYELVQDGMITDAPPAPTKVGFTLVGWYKDDTLTTPWDFAIDTITKNTTLYAKWEVTKHEIFFNTNGGSSIPNQLVTHDTAGIEPISPTKTGYVFTGWYKEPTFVTKWNFATDVVRENVTLYAKWLYNSTPIIEDDFPQLFTVWFETNGGTMINNRMITENELIKDPPIPMKEGHTFEGWYKDPNFIVKWDLEKDRVTTTTKLYAKWLENSKLVPVPIPEPVEPPTPFITFSDISDHWAREMIEEIATQSIVRGYLDGTFRPNEFIKRQHVVVMMERAFDLEPIREVVSFTDVPVNHPYYESIMKLQQAGVIDGSNGAFHPDAMLTRAQMAKILVEALHIPLGGTSSFKDVDTNHWGYSYISALEREGIALGSNGYFKPNDPLTRAQFVAILYRTFN
ncbi:leucine-rich repeat protein [Lysinibacillus piscis]|uniref:SLH domain-containing protein n=1 Tax=Lysinibacillus piscis TaxID=2518931 RepID=A0ABQ5NIX0_9BACI|nr:leucine-rich repeat protein [Lysinibacillus sp. KH24]GLC88053.1 hypothetical protein LYSBPC_11800 [Lysinibacillus sp. KH24]